MTLHAVWTNAGLHVWGDDPEQTGASTPVGMRLGETAGELEPSEGSLAMAEGESSVEQSIETPLLGLSALGSAVLAEVLILPHPRALTHDHLRAAVGELCGDGLLPHAAKVSSLTLFVPHDQHGPLAAGREPAGITHLAPVLVPSLLFSSSQVADLLVPLDEGFPAGRAGRPNPTAISTNLDLAGESLVFFARLHTYVLVKIAAKQFYPDLDQIRAGTFVGLWRLLAHEPAEVDRLSRFAATLPPVARAIADSPDPHDTAPMEPSRIVDTFVASTADAFIRRAVSTDPFFTRVHALAGAPAAAADVRLLSALLGADPVLRGGNTDSNQLLSALLRPWVGKLDTARAGEPWRLVFSLREPALPEDFDEDTDATDGGDLSWRLVLQLRSPVEDAPLLDAEELWDSAGDPTSVFGRGVAERKTQLTTDLARALELCPLLVELARSETPSEIDLSTADANLFIRSWSVPLRSAGFVVELPDWADRRERGLGLMLTVRPEESLLDADDPNAPAGGMARGPNADGSLSEIPSGHFGLESLLDFDWQIAVGDLRLSPAEFKALSQRGSPLVRYKGQWLQIDPDAGARAATFLANEGKGKMTLAQALRTAYGVAPADTGLPVVGLAGKGWIEQLLAQSPSIKLAGVTQPKAFAGTLRPYQLRGLEWMCFLDRLGLGGCLADDMGLGKTVQLISLMLSERENAANTAAPPKVNGSAVDPAAPPARLIGPTLLFAPTSVVGNWVKELTRFAPQLKVLLHHGPERRGGDDFVNAAEQSDIVITSYALAHRDIEELRRPRWHRLAVDEAQKIKNPAAAATVAIRSINSPRRIALTGTPIENHLSELWSIMELLNPGLLGTAADFRERFAVPVEKLGDKEKAQQLRRMIQPFVLRRTKNDPAIAGDLPEKMEMKVYCNLSAEQAALYERITAEMLGQIDAATGIRRRGLILAALTRLKQICDHPVLIEGDNAPSDPASLEKRSGKGERILEMLEEVVQEGDAALVFTQYREMGHLLEKMIQARLNVATQFLHGGTTARQRDAMIDRFQDPNGGIKIFILSLRAGGLGLNLTAANHVFHFDRWWNPAVEQQATDRAHRIGQTRKVQVHQFVCVGTLEERIDKLLTDKLLLADQVVGSGDEWLTSLSTDQLRQYLSLGRDAVGEF